jgi:hypothetical protein
MQVEAQVLSMPAFSEIEEQVRSQVGKSTPPLLA